MPVEITFTDGTKVLAQYSYSTESLALALGGAEQGEGRVGGFQRVSLFDNKEVLINVAGVLYLRETIA